MLKRVIGLSLVAISYLNAEFVRDDSLEVVVDTTKSLIWQDNSDAKTVIKDWQGAIDYCEALNFAGYSDWYLPSYDELKSLLTSTPNSKNGYYVSDIFENINFWYSASTTYPSSDSYAWVVSFFSGSDGSNDKANSHYVRCVRVGELCNFEHLNISSSIELNENSSKTEKFDASTLSVSVSKEPKNGSLILEANSFTYTPVGEFFGNDSFSLKFSDGSCTGVFEKTIQLKILSPLDCKNAYTNHPKAKPIKPNPPTFTKGLFEKTSEFEERKKIGLENYEYEWRATLNNWEISVKNYNFDCKSEAIIKSYDADSESLVVNYSIGTNSIGDYKFIVSPKEAQTFVEIGKNIVVYPTLKYSLEEKLYVEKVELKQNTTNFNLANQNPIIKLDKKEFELSSNSSIDVKFEVSDEDGDVTNVIVSSNPTNGIVEIDNKSFKYIPNSGFFGSDVVKIKAIDGKGGEYEVAVFLQIIQSSITPTPTATTKPTTNSNCDIPKGTARITDTNGCELKDKYKVGDKVKFKLLYNNEYGQLSTGDTTKCGIKNSETILFSKSQSEITFDSDGIANLTCVYNDIVVSHQFKVGNFEGGVNNAIVVVGKGGDDDKLKDAFVTLGNQVYSFLNAQGYSKDEIFYFNSFGSQKIIDYNLDGSKDDVVDKVDYSYSDIQSTLNTLPSSNNPLLIYLIDHGTKGGVLLIDEQNKISANQLKSDLDSFQAKTKRKVIVVVDSCYSGAFVDILKADNRVIISSGHKDQVVPMSTSGISFTNYFIKNLSDKKSLKDSFTNATKSYREIAKNTVPQSHFDDTIANNPFGFLFNASADVIVDFTGKTAFKLDTPKTQTLFLKVKNVIGVEKSKAYVTIIPPQIVSMNQNSDSVIAINSKKVELIYNKSTDEFKLDYNFDTEGIYQISYEITDEANDKSISESVQIQVGSSTNSIEYRTTSQTNLTLQKGWNLVALPTNQNVSTSIFDNYQSIWSYQNGNWSKNPSTLNYGYGFWINSNTPKSYTDFSGETYSADLTNLSSGWNLLGTGENLNTTQNVWIYEDPIWKQTKTLKATQGFWIKK